MPSGNKRLDKELENLNSIDTGGHSDSGKYTNMKNAIGNLCREYEKFSTPDADGNLKKATAEDRARLEALYTEAIKQCKNYLKDKGDSRSSGYGQARLVSVKAIEEILTSDMTALQNISEKDPAVEIPGVIIMARMEDVQLDVAEKDLKLVGGNSSTRIPLAVETADGVVEGFFTEDIDSLSLVGIGDKMRELYPEDYLEVFHNEYASMARVGGRSWNDFRKTFTKAEELFQRYDVDLMRKDGTGFLECFSQLFAEVYENEGREKLEEFVNDEEKRNRLIDYVYDTGFRLHNFYGNTMIGRVEEGQNFPNRNVAMARLARLAGIPDVVTDARRMDVTDKEGNVRHGVFQAKANGRDLNNLKSTDDLFKAMGQNDDIFNTGKVLRDIADIQVFGYIFGATDLHPGNIVVDTKRNDNDEVVVTGIKMIDNDRGGTLLDNQTAEIDMYVFTTPPSKMKVISRDMYNGLMNITREELKLAFTDLGFRDEEIDACYRRIEDVKEAIKQNQIKIKDDEEFKHMKISQCSAAWKGLDGEKKMNLFADVYRYQHMVERGKYPTDESDAQQEITYNKATRVDKKYPGVEARPVYIDDLVSDKDFLAGIKKELKDTDSIVHKNGGSYKWMYGAVKNIINKVTEISASYKEGDAISEEDKAAIDKLYKDLNRASKDYIKTHESPGHNMGLTRKVSARLMEDMKMPRLGGGRQLVTKVTFDQLKEELTKEQEKVKEAKNNKSKTTSKKGKGKVIIAEEMPDDKNAGKDKKEVKKAPRYITKDSVRQAKHNAEKGK
ncbi:MAG: hypothetical protein IKR70_05335 [Lachnospiraceae bacterium]|nr:hypothetical protein [Lachnospiraceae bacterium]